MPIESRSTYNLSFTAASLRPDLARIIAEQYLETGDWSETKRRVLASNALQFRSPSSTVRVERELRQRLQTLAPGQLALLADAAAEDRAALSWLAMLKYNPLTYDFAAELLRDKLASADPVLRPSDYDSFIETKAAGHPELVEMAESTRIKVRRVLLRMLTEAGLLTKGSSFGRIQRPAVSPDLRRAISTDDPRWLAGFLVPDPEIARL